MLTIWRKQKGRFPEKGSCALLWYLRICAGLEYSFWDKEINVRKLRAIAGCKKLNSIDSGDEEALEEAIGNYLDKLAKIRL